MIPRLLLLLASMALIPACSSIPPEIAAPPVALISTSPAPALTQGRALYLGRCTKCHSAEPISNFPQSEWLEDILPDMCKKAKLDAAQRDALTSYILAVLKNPPPPAAAP